MAAASKAVYALPLSVNVLRDPLGARRGSYESGGATDNVIDIWKVTAPFIDVIGPDIYLSDADRYLEVLDLYARPDNALFVPETANGAGYARYFFAALGHGAIGWSPFGIDYTGYTNAPLGASKLNADSLGPFAINYELLGPIEQEVAHLNFEGKLQAVAEEQGRPRQILTFGKWTATVSFGLGAFGPREHPPGNPEPLGRAFIAPVGTDEFLVGGFFCRVDFTASGEDKQTHRQFIRVEEESLKAGKLSAQRIWNGDQTDWGLNFSAAS